MSLSGGKEKGGRKPAIDDKDLMLLSFDGATERVRPQIYGPHTEVVLIV
jgi:hypothetical protein